MPTGAFFRTTITNGTTATLSFRGDVNTGENAVLNAGESFDFTRATGGGTTVTYVYQGLASVPGPGGSTITGFYATNGGVSFLFTSSNPGRDATVTTTPGDFVVCFLAGTLIATPNGAKAVEDLAIGDLVRTAAGRAVPVLWIGRQTVATLFGLRDSDLPVRISAGALGDNLPQRDLRVTAGHAMLIDGVLVNAGALVNGSSITRVARRELGDRFTVYHIETETHDIILAEGAATETFIDNVTRARFDNFAEYQALFGSEERPMQERPEPRAASARQVPSAILARIAALVPAQAAAA